MSTKFSPTAIRQLVRAARREKRLRKRPGRQPDAETRQLETRFEREMGKRGKQS